MAETAEHLARSKGLGPAQQRSAQRHEALERRASAQASVGYGALLARRPAGPQPVQRANLAGLPDSLKSGIELLPGAARDGVPVNDNIGLEREADLMGDRAARATAPDADAGRGMPPREEVPLQPLALAQLMVVQRGGDQSKPDDDAVVEKEYGRYVSEATTLLKNKIGFGASPVGKFDKKHWKQVDDRKYKLAIETIGKPSDAIKALFKADAGVWTFDCAEYVQVCNLYATMEVYGEEAIDDKKLVLRQHESTPFEEGGMTFDRESKGAKFDLFALNKEQKKVCLKGFIEEAPLLKGVPVGSRVCFKNPAAPDTPYRNENAIALGGGNYSAHPMGSGLSADNIVTRLVEINKKQSLGGEDGGLSEIFVSQAEIFPSMTIGKETKVALGL
jgi:hypothetical protein